MKLHENKELFQDAVIVYTDSFSELVFGELPNEADILKSLTVVANRLKSIKWDIKL